MINQKPSGDLSGLVEPLPPEELPAAPPPPETQKTQREKSTPRAIGSAPENGSPQVKAPVIVDWSQALGDPNSGFHAIWSHINSLSARTSQLEGQVPNNTLVNDQQEKKLSLLERAGMSKEQRQARSEYNAMKILGTLPADATPPPHASRWAWFLLFVVLALAIAGVVWGWQLISPWGDTRTSMQNPRASVIVSTSSKLHSRYCSNATLVTERASANLYLEDPTQANVKVPVYCPGLSQKKCCKKGYVLLLKGTRHEGLPLGVCLQD